MFANLKMHGIGWRGRGQFPSGKIFKLTPLPWGWRASKYDFLYSFGHILYFLSERPFVILDISMATKCQWEKRLNSMYVCTKPLYRGALQSFI